MAKPFSSAILRPHQQMLALEPRILFDGAAAVAVDHQSQDNQDASQTAPDHAEPNQSGQPRQLLVVDARIEQASELTKHLGSNVSLLVIDSNTDALSAIGAKLAELGQVDAIQILSHGAAGQFTLGDRTLTADSLTSVSQQLQGWQSHLSDDADIQLYGCRVGAGDAGQALVSALAKWTGADVAASSDDTGAREKGGDWDLEVRSGLIEQPLALSREAVQAFDSLLANASPETSLSQGSSDVLLGDSFEFTVNLSNGSSQVGYAPYVDLYLPSTGKDGDDGISFVKATYLDQTLKFHQVTFDASGNATHPLAVDNNGNPLIIRASDVGLRAGDTMIVLEIPFGSLSQGQPDIAIDVTARLSNLADTSYSNGSPALTIGTRSGFQFGNDSLNNPQADPSLVESSIHTFVVNPTVISFEQSLDMREGETATGPNFNHTLTLTAIPADGQPLSNVVISQTLPPNMQVTAIIPGANGTLTSITLSDGRVITNPALMDAAINSDSLFISAFTVEYSTLTMATDTQVKFYVPDTDANGEQVIDPNSGDAVQIVIDAPTGKGEWVPLDGRDVTAPATSIDFAGQGDTVTFTARSITLQKDVTLSVDGGKAGISPGDTLDYRVNMALSDYFAFGKTTFGEGQFVVTDTLSDGQTLTGVPTLTLFRNGSATGETITLVYTATLNADGTTSITFDIGQSLANANQLISWLAGDLALNDSQQQGATLALLSYSALISQRYTPPAGNPQSEINEGDAIGNSASVTATIVESSINLTGGSESDSSQTTTRIPTSQVVIDLVDINGGANPGGAVELHPGDEVTFQLSYDLVTGDYEQFKLTAYLPLPLFDLSGINWSEGSGVGQWHFGSGDTNLGNIISVTNGPGNSLIFDFGSYDTSDLNGTRIEIQFTLTVGDQPFADQRELDVLAQSSQVTTLDKTQLSSSDVTVITSIAEPDLAIGHGVVSSNNGTVSGTTGSWHQPGSGGMPFTGTVTDINAVNGNVSGIDGGDALRLATAIENRGGGGAFDVVTSINLPAGLSFLNGTLADANLKIYRGDGSLLVLGTDYQVNGNTISFLDAGGQATLLAGRDGTAADLAGSNLVIITYDVTVADNINASSTLETSAVLSNYASIDNGDDFTPTDLTETASEQVAAPTISIDFTGGNAGNASSAGHTSGANLVIGESMGYDIVVTLPEGSTQQLNIDNLIPPGFKLDTSYNGGKGYDLILTGFGGSVSDPLLSGIGGTIGSNGVDARFSFSVSGANADDNAGNNSFTIRVRLIADNVLSNQDGTTLSNGAVLHYQDPDGDLAGGAALVRDITATPAPNAIIQEPKLTVSQDLLITPPPYGFQQGDDVSVKIVISNNGPLDAFDIRLSDLLPSQLSNYSLDSVIYDGVDVSSQFEIVGGQLQTKANANLDIAVGKQLTLVISGVVNASATNLAQLPNQVEVQWTSLDGSVGTSADPAGERTGADGVPGSDVLNDYRAVSQGLIPIASGIFISRVGGVTETGGGATNASHEQVTVGEIIRYKVVALLPQGENDNYELRISLPKGLSFIDKDQVRLALISNGGLTSSLSGTAITGADVTGDETSSAAQAISSTLANELTGLLAAGQIEIVTDADGNQTIIFRLGDISNLDADLDQEGIAIEFNVRVDNSLGNQAGTQLEVSAKDYIGVDPDNLVQRGISQVVYQDIIEPGFANLDKEVIAFNPNPAGNTGSAVVQISFEQNGGMTAFEPRLTDGFPGGSNYALNSLIIELGGTTYTYDSSDSGNNFGLPPGVIISVTQGGSFAVDFSQLDAGAKVTLVYQVDLPNGATIAGTDASLSWSSLPDSFTTWGGDNVGVDGTAGGERTGQDGQGNTLNNYVLTSAAGLGIISGTLWNDTASATASTSPDGPGLANQTVTLVWGGLDNDLTTTGDNQSFVTTTDGSGHFSFGILPSGVYRLDGPAGTTITDASAGTLQVRIDSDGGDLGQVGIALTESGINTGQYEDGANIGYVELNDAPTLGNTTPAQSVDEDLDLALVGLSVADIDAGSGALTLTLTVGHGVLSLGSATGLNVVTNNGGAQLVLTGNLAALNAALLTLNYRGNQDFNGTDTLSVLVNDNGQFGDKLDGDGTPGNAEDALTATTSILITINPVNDTPVANNDSATAIEAGGTANTVPGNDPQGNLISNDTDVDIATNGDILHLGLVASVATGNSATPNSVDNPVTVEGKYGTLYLLTGGGYRYVVDNSNPEVEALRLSGDTLTEQFDYQLLDIDGASSQASLIITIQGANDAPVASDDIGSATEQGVGQAGTNATGNVLGNDSDIDSGDSSHVSKVALGPDTNLSQITDVPAGSTSANGAVIIGLYGTLTLGADGSYRYVIDNSNATVQALRAGDTLTETFSYRATDRGNLNDIAALVITINGTNDAPMAVDDTGSAVEAGGINNATPGSDASGNVLVNDTDPDASNLNETQAVSAVRTGTTSGTGTAGTLGNPLKGAYGWLTLNANGSYDYEIDNSLAAVQALRLLGNTLTDSFTYTLIDAAGATSQANITITLQGANDAPTAIADAGTAIEAGGLNNGIAGSNPVGNVLGNDTDPDLNGEQLTVTGASFGASNVAPGTALNGLYGTLTLNADGSYRYVLDNNNADVQKLLPGETLTELFDYQITDLGGQISASTLTITIEGRNDSPVAVNDTGTAVEAGGVNNVTLGSNATGNVLGNDTDPESANIDERQSVTTVSTGSGTAGTLGSPLRGTYGWLTLNSDGNYTYEVDNSLATVQALRLSGNTLSDGFSYTMVDANGASSSASITITIQGANDAPTAVADAGTAIEAGGLNNGTAGSNPTGNVLSNDTDPDRYGEQPTVTGVSFTGNNAAPGTALNGLYGTLTLNADGSYSYVLDNSNADVQKLRPGETLSEVFDYQMRDLAGLVSASTLTITIQGRNDTPVAVNDTGTAVEAGGVNNTTPGSNATGNVLSNDTDPDSANGSETKTVNTVRTGTTTGAGTTGTLGNQLRGTYGWLTLNANGSYTYVIDNSLAAVQALRTSTDILIDRFSYSMGDASGVTSAANLTIRIEGANDAPLAQNNIGIAVADNGAGNVSNPSGNLLTNDRDVDQGDSLTLTAGRTGEEQAGGSLAPVTQGSPLVLTGQYGTLTLYLDGNYQYVLDINNGDVQGLAPLQTLRDNFTYQAQDLAGGVDLAQLSIIIRGRNDAPVANPDQAQVIEAGGLNNGQPGLDPSGNVLGNDTDLEGDALTVTGVQNSSGQGASLGTVLHGRYGDLVMNADGSWHYSLDNSLAEVQALRGPNQTLVEVFSYQIVDIWGVGSASTLTLTIRGSNDTPIAVDDTTTAIETGGVHNTGAGLDPAGNVLDNDTDVDSQANGETKAVLTVTSAAGVSVNAGQTLQGRYGQLILNSDGSYQYLVDNDNPEVEALRSANQTLTEVFSYRMRDQAGAFSEARLTVVIQGANDNPVAQDDSSLANDQVQPPHTSGNVLPNDSDVDANDPLRVTGVRSGTESGSGQAGQLGQPLAGRYGWLTLNGDGSYSYTIDLTNREVLAAAGLGQVLQDVFTYTLIDGSDATDLAQLVIHLDISAPYVPPPEKGGVGPHRLDREIDNDRQTGLPDITPAIFVTPVVQRVGLGLDASGDRSDGSQLFFGMPPEIRSQSIGQGLGQIEGTFVGLSVQESAMAQELDLASFLGRHGRVDLNADGLLSDESVFALTPQDMKAPSSQGERPTKANSFTKQLQEAAGRSAQPKGDNQPFVTNSGV
ncbi:VCBS domain-containing protein [Aeromonas sp. BIGb0445]|uniref:VCBS domain-containing protein n=1 Tax=Aeromonas sp. BIGb0445 TaxID=2940593 RepID=UPI0021670BD8|nr:VCBS domain-containing protein [Aeromonas sp. BIGb0445]MCS3458284.1 putative repeat protein (TIGR01451 family) [Aeromonas sp. BIGb0445]